MKRIERISETVNLIGCVVLMALSLAVIMKFTMFPMNAYAKDAMTAEECIARYEEDLAALPGELRAAIGEVHYTGEDLGQKFGLGENSCAGVTVGDEIYIYTGRYDKKAMLHEAIHTWDFASGWLSDDAEIARLYEAYNQDVHAYSPNGNDTMEFLAYAGTAYLQGEDLPEEVEACMASIFGSI